MSQIWHALGHASKAETPSASFVLSLQSFFAFFATHAQSFFLFLAYLRTRVRDETRLLERRGADQLESSAHDGEALAPLAPPAPPTARTATRNIVAIMASGETYEVASPPSRRGAGPTENVALSIDRREASFQGLERRPRPTRPPPTDAGARGERRYGHALRVRSPPGVAKID